MNLMLSKEEYCKLIWIHVSLEIRTKTVSLASKFYIRKTPKEKIVSRKELIKKWTKVKISQNSAQTTRQYEGLFFGY